jgi:hypothetical protein
VARGSVRAAGHGATPPARVTRGGAPTSVAR